MKYLISIGVIFALLVGCGSGHESGHDNTSPAPPAKHAHGLIGYGPVNAWRVLDPYALAKSLASQGLTGTEIEYTAYNDTCDKSARDMEFLGAPGDLEVFVDAMRSRGLITLITVVNWNDCLVDQMTTQWFTDRIADIVALGPNLVWLDPVSEPWKGDTNKAHTWAKQAKAMWPGTFVLANAGGESLSPAWNDVAHDYLEAHACSNKQLLDALADSRPNVIHTTDCGPILNPGPQKATDYAQLALANHNNLMIYDWALRTPDIDLGVINAIGAEVQANAP